MLQIHKHYCLTLIMCLAYLSGCTANLTPIEVSDRFWSAVKDRDNPAIKKFIASNSLNEPDLTGNLLQIDSYTFGRTVIDQGQAWVDTTVEISGNDPFSMPVKTVLLQENNQWKVDYEATIAPISGGSDVARLLGNLNELGIQFADKLNQSLGDLQNQLPEIQREIEKIEENMQQKLPELQERMEEFMRQLEEALGGESRPKTPPRTREI